MAQVRATPSYEQLDAYETLLERELARVMRERPVEVLPAAHKQRPPKASEATAAPAPKQVSAYADLLTAVARALRQSYSDAASAASVVRRLAGAGFSAALPGVQKAVAGGGQMIVAGGQLAAQVASDTVAGGAPCVQAAVGVVADVGRSVGATLSSGARQALACAQRQVPRTYAYGLSIGRRVSAVIKARAVGNEVKSAHSSGPARGSPHRFVRLKQRAPAPQGGAVRTLPGGNPAGRNPRVVRFKQGAPLPQTMTGAGRKHAPSGAREPTNRTPATGAARSGGGRTDGVRDTRDGVGGTPATGGSRGMGGGQAATGSTPGGGGRTAATGGGVGSGAGGTPATGGGGSNCRHAAHWWRP